MNNYEQNNQMSNNDYNYNNQNMMNNNGYYNNNNNKQPLSNYIKRFLVGLLLVIAIIFLLLYLFPTKNGLKDLISEAMDETITEKLNPFYDRIFSDNLNTMKEVAIAYYTTERLPKKVGDTEKLTLGEMIEMKLLLEIKDKNGEMCDLDESYVSITKEEKEYKMKVNLKCGEEEEYIIVYLGCYDYCLNDICEKKEETKKVATTTKASNNIIKTIKKTITKKVNKITNIIIKPITPIDPVKPDPEPDKPEKEVYKYLYEKEVSINHEKEYSKWSDWSDDIEYDPNNNNINWGTHEFVINEKNGSKTTKTTKEVVDTTKPIYQNKQVLMGTYSRWTCGNYDYFIDQTTNTTYKTTSEWIPKGIVTTSTIPAETNNVKYEFVGVSFDNCGDVCDIARQYKWKKYVRSTTTTTDVSTSKENLTAKCTNVVKKDIPVYANVSEFVAYSKKLVTETKTVYYYHTKTRKLVKDAYTEKKTYEAWSYSKNDETLISQGYKYTGKYEKVTK